jgi:hypothetical protein
MFDNLVQAGVAQLVEHNLAKVDVAGSSPVSRSKSTTVDFLVYWRSASQAKLFFTEPEPSGLRPRPKVGINSGLQNKKESNKLVLKSFYLYGGVAKRSKAKVCKTFIHRFESDRRL